MPCLTTAQVSGQLGLDHLSLKVAPAAFLCSHEHVRLPHPLGQWIPFPVAMSSPISYLHVRSGRWGSGAPRIFSMAYPHTTLLRSAMHPSRTSSPSYWWSSAVGEKSIAITSSTTRDDGTFPLAFFWNITKISSNADKRGLPAPSSSGHTGIGPRPSSSSQRGAWTLPSQIGALLLVVNPTTLPQEILSNSLGGLSGHMRHWTFYVQARVLKGAIVVDTSRSWSTESR